MNTLPQGPVSSVPVSVSGAFCYALGPMSGLYFLLLSVHRHIWPVRFHAVHSLLLSGVFVAGWLTVTAAEAACPWFTASLVREFRIVAMIGAVPVWILAMYSALRGYRFSPIPLVHELAVKLARHRGHPAQGDGNPPSWKT